MEVTLDAATAMVVFMLILAFGIHLPVHGIFRVNFFGMTVPAWAASIGSILGLIVSGLLGVWTGAKVDEVVIRRTIRRSA